MKFIKYDLGELIGGCIVEVTLSGGAANVRLMDGPNFERFRGRKRHDYVGGRLTKPDVRLKVPHSGRWYLTVDLGGHAGSVRAGVRVLPARSSLRGTPLSAVPSLVRAVEPSADGAPPREYDVFIAHAAEDKDSVVRPLALVLREAGLKVGYDEFELAMGDGLRQTVDRGLAASRFGIVIASRSFFSKGWPSAELEGLVTQAANGEQVLLPIWHDVSKQEVVQYGRSLGGRLARSTRKHSVAAIAQEIAEILRGGAA